MKCPNCDTKLPISLLPVNLLTNKPLDRSLNCPGCGARIKLDKPHYAVLSLAWGLLTIALSAIPIRFSVHLILEQSRWVEGLGIALGSPFLFAALLYPFFKPRIRFIDEAQPMAGLSRASQLGRKCMLAVFLFSLVPPGLVGYLPPEYPSWVNWSLTYAVTVIAFTVPAYLFYRHRVRFYAL